MTGAFDVGRRKRESVWMAALTECDSVSNPRDIVPAWQALFCFRSQVKHHCKSDEGLMSGQRSEAVLKYLSETVARNGWRFRAVAYKWSVPFHLLHCWMCDTATQCRRGCGTARSKTRICSQIYPKSSANIYLVWNIIGQSVRAVLPAFKMFCHVILCLPKICRTCLWLTVSSVFISRRFQHASKRQCQCIRGPSIEWQVFFTTSAVYDFSLLTENNMRLKVSGWSLFRTTVSNNTTMMILKWGNTIQDNYGKKHLLVVPRFSLGCFLGK